MTGRRSFAEAFLDGVTMAGFPDGTARPGGAESVVDPGRPEDQAAFAFVFEPESLPDDISERGDLHIVPEGVLVSMMRRLEIEIYERRQHAATGTGYGSTE